MWARNGRQILPEMPDFHVPSFTCRKSMTWDRRLYFPSKGRRAEDFFALKNPTASAGFEPANLGTKGQHATPRPPKPQIGVDKLNLRLDGAVCFVLEAYVCVMLQGGLQVHTGASDVQCGGAGQRLLSQCS
jgi:hypothetical protein